MGKSAKKSVVGYKYYLSLHFAICQGEVDAVRSLWWSDKTYWSGDVKKTDNGDSVLTAASNTGLFGGDSSEGGAEGVFEFGAGSYKQNLVGVKSDGTYDTAKVAAIYGPSRKVTMPDMAVNYRGLTVIMLHDNYIGNNAYLKDFSVEVERYWSGWQPGLCRIGDAMNPAHIIYESLTNEDWGLGYPASTIGEDSFLASAQTLYDEGLGLSFVWDDGTELIDFIEQVKTCINASFYLDRRTGLWNLRLIRAGAVSQLTLDETNSRLDSFSRKMMGETYNEMSVKWTDPTTEDYATVTVQDAANIEAQGRVVSTSQEYVGVRTSELAATLAQRDLQVASAQLATAEVICNRLAWALVPGDVVTFNWAPLGLSGLAMRVVETTQAEPGTDDITLQLTEDIFSRTSANFTGVQEPGWTNPSAEPTLFRYTQPWEFPFWYVLQNSGVSADALPEYAAYGTELAADGNTDIKQVRLMSYIATETGMAWSLRNIGPATPVAATSTAMPKALTSVVSFSADNQFRLSSAQENSFVLITNGTTEEIAQVTATDATTGAVTLKRGLMDTHPQVWPSGTLVYFIGTDMFVVDSTQRSYGEVAQYKALMQTSIGFMDPDSVTAQTITFKGRYELPYPVGNVTIGGAYWPGALSVNDPTFRIAWSTRNRLLQDAPEQITWDSGSIVAEDGTTTGITIYSGTTVVFSVSGLTGTSYDVPVNTLATGSYRIVVYTERDGRRNFQDFDQTLTLTIPVRTKGYGNSYGYSYGV